MNKIICFLIIFFITTNCLSQRESRMDSLQNYLKTTKNEDSVKACTQLELSLEYFNLSDYKQAIFYSQQAIELSSKIKFQAGIANAADFIGAVYWEEGNYTLALNFFYRSLEISKKKGISEGLAAVSNNIGLVYWKQGKYNKAIEWYYKCLKIREQLLEQYKTGEDIKSCRNSTANLYSNMGLVYCDLGNFSEALKSYSKSLKIYKELKNDYGQGRCLGNMGLVYQEQKKYDEALEKHFLSLEINKIINNKEGLALNYNNIGLAYQHKEKYNQALEYYFISSKLDEEIGKSRDAESAVCFNNIGNVYYSLKNYKEALNYSKKALIIAKEKGLLPAIMESEKTISKIYEKIGDNAKALDHYKEYTIANDSLFNETKNKQILEINAKYETEKKEKQIALLTKEKTVQNLKLLNLTNEKKLQEAELNLRNVIVVAVVLISCVLFLLYNRFHLQQKHSAEKQLIEVEKKVLLLQMNPHFIFNSLSSIGSLMYENNSAVAIRYLNRFSKLMRLILEYSSEPFIPLEKEIELLTNYLEIEKFRFEDKFDFSIHVDSSVPIDAIIPPMLIQPHLENAIVHGFGNYSGKGNLQLHFKEWNNEIICEITDNGIGREKSKQLQKEMRHKSMATDIIRKRLKFINQKNKKSIRLMIEDLKDHDLISKGTKVTLIIPFK